MQFSRDGLKTVRQLARRGSWAVLLWLACGVAWGDFVPTEAEWRAWPEYCRGRWLGTTFALGSGFSVPPAVLKNWERKYGSFWRDVHHYCMGRTYLGRARAASNSASREGLLHQALNEIAYTVRGLDAGSPIASEVLAYQGLVLAEQGRIQDAEKEFERGISVQPSASASYVAYAEVLLRNDRVTDARRVLERALPAVQPPSSELHYFLGHVYLREGKYDEALEHAKKARTLGYPLAGLEKLIEEKKKQASAK